MAENLQTLARQLIENGYLVFTNCKNKPSKFIYFSDGKSFGSVEHKQSGFNFATCNVPSARHGTGRYVILAWSNLLINALDTLEKAKAVHPTIAYKSVKHLMIVQHGFLQPISIDDLDFISKSY